MYAVHSMHSAIMCDTCQIFDMNGAIYVDTYAPQTLPRTPRGPLGRFHNSTAEFLIQLRSYHRLCAKPGLVEAYASHTGAIACPLAELVLTSHRGPSHAEKLELANVVATCDRAAPAFPIMSHMLRVKIDCTRTTGTFGLSHDTQKRCTSAPQICWELDRLRIYL